MKVKLTPELKERLLKPVPKRSAGFQNFAKKLRLTLNKETDEIEYTDDDEAQIRQYADNGSGGYQSFYRKLYDLINPQD